MLDEALVKAMPSAACHATPSTCMGSVGSSPASWESVASSPLPCRVPAMPLSFDTDAREVIAADVVPTVVECDVPARFELMILHIAALFKWLCCSSVALLSVVGCRCSRVYNCLWALP